MFELFEFIGEICLGLLIIAIIYWIFKFAALLVVAYWPFIVGVALLYCLSNLLE